ncbi:tripartite tricarboxylate transporter TctB family protein [Ciceribacter azotifigens]|uniref:tripartite tricarboxylate transporter TctB family protein n=1 Tax=Ciceribacter azotifigens TaxID=2069303 RepID=UPI003A8C5743
MKVVQDTLLGFFFTLTGCVALSMAWQYPFGTSGRMGPGYFPVIVSGLLVVTGIGVIIRSMAASGDTVAQVRWKPLLLVPGSVVVFGLAVEPLGLFAAVLLMLVISAATSSKFRWNWTALAGALLFAGLCCLLFVQLIGLPMPLVGTWLQ